MIQHEKPPVVKKTETAPETKSCASRTKEYLSRRVFDVIFTIALLVLGGSATYYPPRPVRFFTERDPSLSYPYYGTSNEEITLTDLIVLTIIPTIMIVLICQVLVWLCQRRRPGAIPHAAVYFWGRPLLSLGQSEGFSLLLTEILKNWQARYRPNFFAACNYAGYRDALATGDYSYYDNHTIQGHAGDLSKCFDLYGQYDDSFKSNPSGHASVIFAAWTGMGLILTYLFRSQHQYLPESCGRAWVSLFMVIPIVGGALISVTRTRDYVHDFADVALGAGIGIGSAVMFFLFNYGTDPSHDGLFRAYKNIAVKGQELPQDVDDTNRDDMEGGLGASYENERRRSRKHRRPRSSERYSDFTTSENEYETSERS